MSCFRTREAIRLCTYRFAAWRIATVAKGDTVDSLAKRMDFETFVLQRLQVLNGLTVFGKLKVGTRMKIVIER